MRYRIAVSDLTIVERFALEHRGGFPLNVAAPHENLVYLPVRRRYADGRDARLIASVPGVQPPLAAHELRSEETPLALKGFPHLQGVGFVFHSHHHCVWTTGPLDHGQYVGDLFIPDDYPESLSRYERSLRSYGACFEEFLAVA